MIFIPLSKNIQVWEADVMTCKADNQIANMHSIEKLWLFMSIQISQKYVSLDHMTPLLALAPATAVCQTGDKH